MRSTWIEHKGKRIFFADYSNFGSDANGLQQEVELVANIIANEPPKSVLVLISFEGTLETLENLRIVRKAIPRANRSVIKRALLGITGARKIFIATFANVLGDTRVMAFDTREQALNWLVDFIPPRNAEDTIPVSQPLRPQASEKAMQSYWVEHKGKRIFVANFSNFNTNGEAVRAECEHIKAALRNEPPDSVLAITNVSGTNATPQILQALKSLVGETNVYIHRRAVVGITGYQRYFLEAFTAFTGEVTFVPLDSVDRALDWITRQQ